MQESTFELSLFAESLYEMLQYQMGSRILTFLQKLRVKFVTKRNQCKRQRDEIPEKERDKKSPVKGAKTSDLPVKEQDIKSETLNSAQPDDDKTKVKEEDKSVDHVDEVKMENEKDVVKMEDESDDEDPEEDPEEDEEMEESGTQHDLPNVSKEEKTDVNAPEKVEGNDRDKAEDSSKEKEKPKAAETELKSDENEKTDSKADTGKKETSTDTVKKETSTVTEVAIDKELLQAFRFFDRNRAGYVRVEDMRLIIHNLGKFLSHRDVKECIVREQHR